MSIGDDVGFESTLDQDAGSHRTRASTAAGDGLTSRRAWLRSAGAAGIGSALSVVACGASGSPDARAPSAAQKVPTRPFGRTGTSVSSLALGGYFDVLANQDVLSRAIDLGVTYWEATVSFGGKGYGEYFRAHPATRAEIFLLAKTQGAPLMQLDRRAAVAQMEKDLSTALADAGTSYIDFFIIGAIRDGSLLNDDVRRWVEGAKAAGKIRYFGFSTHSNMVDCLTLASELDWIDGAVTTYNYRLMQVPQMQRAIEACAQRGMALTAIKSQALDPSREATVGDDTPAARQFLQNLSNPGGDEFQQRLRAIWSNPAISSILSMMTDTKTLSRNVVASWQATEGDSLQALSLNRTPSQGRYCTGCASVCESSVAENVPIADVMRHLMYARNYRDPARARAEFAALGRDCQAALGRQDYALAEQRCPQRLPIARLMQEALRELG